ncbi:MAG: hypothetical protein Satyrvirus27_4 [Satyrvirus sp.]|uniref:Uncharacterized protein n=1 Tax=Satyrvirus sp. TaxID=2487771 RepID=A0A3G5AEM9_9VIRU|nr:MAG: hypothetical protein Satyrvirus27_4 [Satyrvirus sp.]
MPYGPQYLFVWDKTPLGVKIQCKSTSFSNALRSVTDDYESRLVTLFENANFTQLGTGPIWMFYVPSVQDLLKSGYYLMSAVDRSTAIKKILDRLVKSFFNAMLKLPFKKSKVKHYI